MFLLQHFDCHTDLLMMLGYPVQARKNTCLHAFYLYLSHTARLCMSAERWQGSCPSF